MCDRENMVIQLKYFDTNFVPHNDCKNWISHSLNAH